jgi:hypothetical protein
MISNWWTFIEAFMPRRRSGLRPAAVACSTAIVTSALGQTPAVFNFDSGSPLLPIQSAFSSTNATRINSGGIVAGFLAPIGTVSVQSAPSFKTAGLPQPGANSGLSGQFLYASAGTNVLEIRFDRLVSSVSLNIVTPDILAQRENPTAVALVALTNAPALPYVGGVTNSGKYVDAIFAAGTLSLNPGTPFGAARVLVPAGQFTGTPYFLVDNISVVASTDTRRLISPSPAPAVGGSVSGGGLFEAGSSAALTPTPANGYVFSQWIEGTTSLGTNQPLTLTVSSNRWITALFSKVYTVAVSPSPLTAGTVTGSGSYPGGSPVTVVATAKTGYSFVSWIDRGVAVSTSLSYTFVASTNRTLTATFLPGSPTTVSANPAFGGNVTGAGIYTNGATVKVVARANTGYTFVQWLEGSTPVSTDAAYVYVSTGSRSLTAQFAYTPRYTITTLAAPTSAGTTTGDGTYKPGDTVVVTAVPGPGQVFENWTLLSGFTPTVVSTDPVYSFSPSISVTLTAHFTAGTSPSVIIALLANAQGGSTTGGGTYPAGSRVTLSATPLPGWSFVGWSETGAPRISSPSLTFNASTNRVLKAVFSPPLAIHSVEGGFLRLSWPSSASGFSLENSADGGVSWTAVSDAPAFSSGESMVVAVPDSPHLWFRLRQP